VLRYLAMPQPSQVAGGPPLVLLNQSGMPGGLDAGKFARAIGREPDLVIPHLQGTPRGAANLGQLPGAASARFATAIERLAFRAGAIDPHRAPRRKFWNRR
jgi:Flp pilus assembly CpaE family ATPase